MQGEGHSAAADLGGSIITGIDGNPLAVLAAQQGIPMHSIGTDCELHLQDGSQPPKTLDEQVCLNVDSLAQQGIPPHSIGTEYKLHLPGGLQPPKFLDDQVRCSQLCQNNAVGHSHAQHRH